MNATASAYQRVRLTGPINFGSTFQPPKAAPFSSILEFTEKKMDIYVTINEQKRVELRISNAMKVSDVIDQIFPNLEEGNERPFLVYGNEAMAYNDFIGDWDVLDGSIVRVRGRELVPITISVKLPEVNQSILEFTVNQTIRGSKIKEAIQQFHGLEIGFMRIFHGQVEINDESSLADLGIYANCIIVLRYGKPKGINSSSMLTLIDSSEIRLQRANATNEILSLRPNEVKNSLKIQCNETYQAKSFSKITLTNKNQISCCEGCYFFTSDQRWVPISSDDRDRLRIGDKIQTISQEFVAVENIHPYFQNRSPTAFTYMLLDKYQPYFVNGILVSPSLDIQVLFRGRNYIKFISVHMLPRMTVSDLKVKISKKMNIDPKDQHLFIQSQQLILKDTTQISDIYSSNIIIQLFLNEAGLKDLIKTQKIITITFEKVTKSVKYRLNAQATCEQLIRRQFSSRIQEIQYIGALCGSKVIDMGKKLQEIITFEQESFYYQTLEIFVIKFPERFKLSKILQEFRPRNRPPIIAKKSFFTAIVSFFGNRSHSQDPILVDYKANHMLNETRALLNNLNRADLSENAQQPQYQVISERINFLHNQPQFIGKCYRILSSTTVFALNSIINIREFLSCTPDKTKAQTLLGLKGTIFEIQSISGKSVDLYNEGKQVLFLPFTYFIVDKIVRDGQITHFQLSEMPTSLAFNKPIILWVDDKPQNNTQSITKYRKEGTQVIQLSSTSMARRWFQEFGWVTNRLNLNLRVITDMVRFQPDRLGVLKQNYYAGVDLIEYLFTDRGFTTPVLVFCNVYKAGKENLRRRNIRRERFYQVTNQYTILSEYMAFRPLTASNMLDQ